MMDTTIDQTVFVDNSSAASVRLIKGPLYYEAQKKKIQLDVPNEFTFLRKIIKPFVNRKLTVEDVNRLSTSLNTALIEHGYVTSHHVLYQILLRRFFHIQCCHIFSIPQNTGTVTDLKDFIHFMADIKDRNSLCFQIPYDFKQCLDL